jgi:Zn-dependent protease with chaperone function
VAVRSPENVEEVRTIRSNRQRAVMISLVLPVIVGVVLGAVVAVAVMPLVGLGVLVVVAVVWTLSTWRTASSSVIRAIGAEVSEEHDRPRLHNLVNGLCATMGLPTPAILVVDSPRPNAMAVGRDPKSASLVVTSGLDLALSLVELEGVLAHELVHIKRHDTVLSGTVVAAVAPLAVLIGTERAAARVHRLVGPGREFAADQRAATVVRYPVGLGSALRSMSVPSERAPSWPPGTGRRAALTRWLWIDPTVPGDGDPAADGELDDPAVRAAALSLL